jgi:hypothetical protein
VAIKGTPTPTPVVVDSSLCLPYLTRECLLCKKAFYMGGPGSASMPGSCFDKHCAPLIAQNFCCLYSQYVKYLPAGLKKVFECSNGGSFERYFFTQLGIACGKPFGTANASSFCSPVKKSWCEATAYPQTTPDIISFNGPFPPQFSCPANLLSAASPLATSGLLLLIALFLALF